MPDGDAPVASSIATTMAGAPHVKDLAGIIEPALLARVTIAPTGTAG